ncbi:MAG: DUF481 domain-containing protein [Planctomycetota bacterium]|nr:DUF481 domain-containing protein [Planctomycetota bacterium]
MILSLTLLLAAQGGIASEPVITPAQDQDPVKVWSGSVDGGLTLVGGNNDSTTGSLNARIGRAWGAWAVDAYAGYTGVRTSDPVTGDGTTTARIITLGGGGKRFLDDTNNLYVYLKGGDRRDEPNGLAERFDFGGGVGYKFDLYESAFLALEGGASWVSEELVGVAEKEETGAARIAYNAEAPLAGDVSLYGNGEYLNGGEVESFTSITGVKWNFRPNWNLQASIQVNYDGSPAPGFDDTDTIFVLGVGVSF